MHHKRTLLTLAVGALAVVSAACGNSSDNDNAKAGDAERTVNVEMVDVAFKPTEVTVAKGETVRFVFKNNGKTEHEAFLGTPAEQKDHDKEMSGEDSGGHDMGNMGAATRPPSPSTPASPTSSRPASTMPAPTRSAATNRATTPPA
jgi:uncharacterized cupredoxin-like copper-binding protein